MTIICNKLLRSILRVISPACARAALTALPSALLAASLAFGLVAAERAAWAAAPESPAPVAEARWPDGTQVLPVEDLDGVLLVQATLRGHHGRDTSGAMVLDTGAGFLALDRGVSLALGLTDTLAAAGTITLAARALPRLVLAGLEVDRLEPVMTIDGEVVRRVTDRDVLGLVGQKVLAPWIVWIDYPAGELALLPAGDTRDGERASAASRRALPMLSPAAQAVAFRLAGDGKLLVGARVSRPDGSRASPVLTLALDTGASKTVLFEPALARDAPESARWRSLRGLAAPTLFGTDEARIVRVPRLALLGEGGEVEARDTDAATLGGELPAVLEQVLGERVHGLVGYSYLRRFRVAIDFPRRLVWLDPADVTRDTRPDEYSHVGVQIERADGELRVAGVARPSPAAEAGIGPGDVLEAIDGRSGGELGLMEAVRLLEGSPGSRVELELRGADGTRRLVILTRRRLL